MTITEILTQSEEFHEPTEKFVRTNPTFLKLRDELNEKINSGSLQFEEVPCLCGNNSFALISDYDKFGIIQKNVICVRCGLIQANPRMTQTSLNWFYGSDVYGNLYGRIKGRDSVEFILSETTKRPRKRFELISKEVGLSHIHSVLEIGCAGGWSLYPFFKIGKKVVGYDYGPSLIEAGKSLGMDLRVGKIEDDKTNHEKYDLIMLCHVVEHFPDPVSSLRNLQKYLTPNGHLYIEVPEIKELSLAAFVNAHTYSFSKQTFLHYMGHAGLFPIIYNHDKEPLGSQWGIFRQADQNDRISPLTDEFRQMSKLIRREDKKNYRWEMLKKILKKAKILKIGSALAHQIRKRKKHALARASIKKTP